MQELLAMREAASLQANSRREFATTFASIAREAIKG
jgi:hypothetical protein